MLAHEKDLEDAKRRQVEALEKVREPIALIESAPTPLPASVTAEVPAQTPMSREAAERLLDLWCEEDDDAFEKTRSAPDLDDPEQSGFTLDFAADSAISAADYLAPDDVGGGGQPGRPGAAGLGGDDGEDDGGGGKGDGGKGRRADGGPVEGPGGNGDATGG